MKIKLQDYSLISNEWIEEKIKHLKWSLDHIPKSYIPKHQAQIYVLSELQKELIPAEKLAEHAWNDGYFEGGDYLSDEYSKKAKQYYLNNEIEIQ